MKSAQAYTLLEMCITLAIAAALALLAVPTLRHFVSGTQADMLQSQLLDAIELASQEARIRGLPVVLRQSDHPSERLLVFIDTHQDGSVHDHEQLLAVTQLTLQQGKLYWRAYPHYRDYVQFFPNGIKRSDNGAFWYCDARAHLMWAMMLSQAASARVVYPDQQGNIQDSHGGLITCLPANTPPTLTLPRKGGGDIL